MTLAQIMDRAGIEMTQDLPVVDGPQLSDEQQAVLDAVAAGENVIVDAVIGSGKTSTIQRLCAVESGKGRSILYLTYSRLLKADAQGRVGGAKVQNYHGLVYPHLLRLGIDVGVAESVKAFNIHFDDIRDGFEHYDLLVVDEYQDINTEYADLLNNIASTNAQMQVVFVGDLSQKVRSDTTLDVQAFAHDFCAGARMLPFTRSFRMGPTLGSALGKAWNKPIVGVNTDQKVRVVDFATAVDLISETEPGDLLCLGKRNGSMPAALNQAEKKAPSRYNKKTVFASIRDGDSDIRPGEGVAVFTTFDACKGMERPVCVIFDYHAQNWDARGKFPNTDYEVLRNVFLVAASRGKYDVVFVRTSNFAEPTVPVGSSNIGLMPMEKFTQLPRSVRPQYQSPFQASTCFDFKYAENVDAAMDLITRRRLDDGRQAVIEMPRADGLIDLSPVVGMYQEALFFADHDAASKALLMAETSPLVGALIDQIGEGPWEDSLVLAAIATGQMRYAEQVSATIGQGTADQLVARLGEHLDPDCAAQVGVGLEGVAKVATDSTPIRFTGIADAIHRGQVYELKFVSTLDHSMFLQTALYVVMARRAGLRVDSGVLWNTRSGERWEVTVPDERRFLDAVVTCVTKQSYRYFADY